MRNCEHCSSEELEPENCWCFGFSSVLLLLQCVWAYQQPCWNPWVSQMFHSCLLFTVGTNLSSWFLQFPLNLTLMSPIFVFTFSFRNLLALHRMATLHRDELGQVSLIFWSLLTCCYVLELPIDLVVCIFFSIAGNSAQSPPPQLPPLQLVWPGRKA